MAAAEQCAAEQRFALRWMIQDCLGMKLKVLVTSASRHEATHEIASAIATGLVNRGVAAEPRPIQEVTEMGDYGAVVLGSAVYMNRWLSEARRFAEVHARSCA